MGDQTFSRRVSGERKNMKKTSTVVVVARNCVLPPEKILIFTIHAVSKSRSIITKYIELNFKRKIELNEKIMHTLTPTLRSTPRCDCTVYTDERVE